MHALVTYVIIDPNNCCSLIQRQFIIFINHASVANRSPGITIWRNISENTTILILENLLENVVCNMVFTLFQVWSFSINIRFHNIWHNSERLTSVRNKVPTVGVKLERERDFAGSRRSFWMTPSVQRHTIINCDCQWNVDENMPYMPVAFLPVDCQVTLGATTPANKVVTTFGLCICLRTVLDV